METLQPVVKPLQDMIHSTKLIPNVDVKNEKHILAELEDNSSIDGNYDKKSEKNDDAMSIEDPDSIAQAIRERPFRYQPYLRDQKKRKLVDTSFLKSPRGNWVNEKRLRDESGYKNPLALPIEEAMTQRAAIEFVSDHNEQESRLIGKIGQMIHLSMSSMESYFTSKFREVEVYTVKISEDMFRFRDEFHRLRGLLSARIEEMDALLKEVREEEQGNRVDRDKLNRMGVSHVITRENFANIVRLLEEHNSDSMKNFKSIDERFSTLNDSCQELQNRYDNLTRNVEEIKEDLLNTRSKLENEREANTERLETDELNEKLGNFPEHILGNEGGEVQDISKDEEVDKKEILLEENVEVDEDEFKKLEERMYNE
ncbi:hypothetical protein QAD02_003005 [Eretmocerus hayati]|uniref:Uncharacterized protein n=1 Tax=Eretmocerus hayati TaxID=131215 RepID=A0ACC2NLG0_9HYME|nr:hypothetical protein QAD02_003005 [Eretmocerus hayati]